jgi:rhodanese-related sulfurtransferase
MRKTISCKSCQCILTILLLFAIRGSFQEIVSAAQESTEPVPARIQIVHPEVPRIPATQVKELLAKKGEIIVVDVNPADHFELWHIPGAVNVPYTMKDLARRERKLQKLPVGKLIVLYCFCEEGGDSSEMALELRRLGYPRDKVKVLDGGLTKWDEKGYPMFKQKIPE